MKLVVPFLTDNLDFALGVEIGMLHERLSTCNGFHGQMIHTANADQVRSVCEAHGYDCGIAPIEDNDEWSTVTAIRRSVN